MEVDCECLFCQRDDLNLYEINQNSIIIGSELVDFTEIIFEIFNAHPNNDVINYICEVCKDLITQFYVFKQGARNTLVGSSIFDKLRKFLLNNIDNPESPIVKCTTNKFIVSYVAVDEPNLQYSVVKPIVKYKTAKEEPLESNQVEVLLDQEEVESKFVETVIEEIQEEEAYAVETIIDNEDNEDPEQFYEEDDGLKNEADDLEISSEKDSGLTQAELRKHTQSHTTHSNKRKAAGSEVCCGVGFKDFKCYTIHQKAHENFEAIIPHMHSFVCSECNMMFSNEEDLLTHIEKHAEGTEYVIDRRGAFDDHFTKEVSDFFEYVEDQSDLVSCGHCKKRLNESDMKIHLLFFHTTTVYCPLDTRCFDGTKHVRLFSEHIRNKHPEIFEKNMLFSCRHCNQSFTTCFEKLAHMKLCNAKPFECVGHCNKRFASEWLLKNHLKNVNGDDRFACDMCGKKCVSRSDLQIHERMHTNERPYPCPICQKKFKTSANRSSHMDIHESEKKHECPTCGEKFQTRPILRKHKKIHDEKYLEECMCKICDRKYLTKQHLLRHLKTSHNVAPDLGTDDIKKFFTDYLEAN